MLYIDRATRIRVLDQYNLVLEKSKQRKDSKSGKSKRVWNIIGYYGNLGEALRGVIEHRLFCSIKQKQDLDNIVGLINDISKKIGDLKYDTRTD